MDYIFTTYFTKNRNFSQHDCSKGGCKPNNFQVMKKWYESVWRLQLNAVIFHNELSCGFMNKYETKNIKFVLVAIWNFCSRRYLDLRIGN